MGCDALALEQLIIQVILHDLSAPCYQLAENHLRDKIETSIFSEVILQKPMQQKPKPEGEGKLGVKTPYPNYWLPCMNSKSTLILQNVYRPRNVGKQRL